MHVQMHTCSVCCAQHEIVDDTLVQQGGKDALCPLTRGRAGCRIRQGVLRCMHRGTVTLLNMVCLHAAQGRVE